MDNLPEKRTESRSEHGYCPQFPECAGDIANAACRCSEGDAFKLYYRFKSSEGSGVIGVTLTVFVYIVLFLIALFFLYVFLLNLYLNGRMLDVYRRIYADDNAFTLPADHEVRLYMFNSRFIITSVRDCSQVSPAELQWVLMKAKRWRGPKGTSRKVSTCNPASIAKTSSTPSPLSSLPLLVSRTFAVSRLLFVITSSPTHWTQASAR